MYSIVAQNYRIFLPHPLLIFFLGTVKISSFPRFFHLFLLIFAVFINKSSYLSPGKPILHIIPTPAILQSSVIKSRVLSCPVLSWGRGQYEKYTALVISWMYGWVGRRVVTVDARNHGDSPHTDSMSYVEMAADISLLIQVNTSDIRTARSDNRCLQ